MRWTGRTTVIVGVVLAAGLSAGAIAQSGAKDRAAQDKDRQVRIIERVGPRQLAFALGGPRLGVSLSDVTEGAGGVRVAEIEDGSAAAKAGVKPGDVITDFDGERVRSVRQMQRLVSETPAGRPVKITVSREGKRAELTATLEERDTPALLGLDKEQLQGEIQRGLEEGTRGMREFRWEMQKPQVPDHPDTWNFRVEPRWPIFEWSAGAGRLGVTVQGLTDQLRDHFGVKGGVLVASVSPESAASRAGIKAGDIITTVAGKPIEDTGDLVGAIRSADEGAEIDIGIVRDRKEQTLKVKLSDGERGRRVWTI